MCGEKKCEYCDNMNCCTSDKNGTYCIKKNPNAKKCIDIENCQLENDSINIKKVYLYYTGGGIVGLFLMCCVVYCFWNIHYKDEVFDYINDNCCCGMLEYFLCVFEICSCVKETIEINKENSEEKNEKEIEEKNEKEIEEKNENEIEEKINIKMKITEKYNIECVDGRKRIYL